MNKSLMIQGTMSGVGKSLITAGLCRVFKQDGYTVAPFKSQNMALNSFVTGDGLEIGRAQAMQAEFAGILPDVRMNPILLKPTGNKTSQVIVNGEVYKDMPAGTYFDMKENLMPMLKEVYEDLQKEYDIVVLEGAGSPVELNLLKNDIVNMGMAKIAKSPVILVGDIDRGGIFATLLGTKMLLDEDSKRYLKGFIINKFRGDIKLLENALLMIENMSKNSILGVLPLMDIVIDDEDSLSDRFSLKPKKELVDIAIIKLPHMSNYTDFIPFELIDGVSISYTQKDLGNPDVIIIPGSKNTLDDLNWLETTGLKEKIIKLSETKIIIGICGGYQMLGKVIKDENKELKGLNLLDCKTNFYAGKIRRQVRGKVRNIEGVFSEFSGKTFEGYEIHMGKTSLQEGSDFFSENLDSHKEPRKDGTYKNNVFGTYVHGIFDSGEVAEALVKTVLKKKGLDFSKVKAADINAHKEKEYNKIANTLREYLDIKKIYEVIERGV